MLINGNSYLIDSQGLAIDFFERTLGLFSAMKSGLANYTQNMTFQKKIKLFCNK
jgi:hypothetical protein